MNDRLALSWEEFRPDAVRPRREIGPVVP
jgi:hypothetical protein